MLIPNASEIARRKWTVRTCIRASALLFAAYSINPIVSWLIEGYMDSDMFDMYFYAERVARAVICIVLAIIAWFLQGPISRMLVPVPNGARCPKCNHRIEGMAEPICTECGLQLTPEFIAPLGLGGAPDTHTPDPRITPFVITNRRAITSNAFRIGGILMLLWGLPSVAGSLSYLIMGDPDFFTYAAISLVESILKLLMGVLLTFWPARLARFCVPFPKDPDIPASTEIPTPQSPTNPCGNGPATG